MPLDKYHWIDECDYCADDATHWATHNNLGDLEIVVMCDFHYKKAPTFLKRVSREFVAGVVVVSEVMGS